MLQTNSAMPSRVLCEPLNYATCDYPICATCDLRCQAAISVTGAACRFPRGGHAGNTQRVVAQGVRLISGYIFNGVKNVKMKITSAAYGRPLAGAVAPVLYEPYVSGNDKK